MLKKRNAVFPCLNKTSSGKLSKWNHNSKNISMSSDDADTGNSRVSSTRTNLQRFWKVQMTVLLHPGLSGRSCRMFPCRVNLWRTAAKLGETFPSAKRLLVNVSFNMRPLEMRDALHMMHIFIYTFIFGILTLNYNYLCIFKGRIKHFLHF